MTAIEREPLRRATAPVPSHELREREQRFERALQREGQSEEGSAGGEGDGEGFGSAGGGQHRSTGTAFATGVPARALVPLQRSLAAQTLRLPLGSVLEELLAEIAQGLRAGRRLPGDRWRLEFRLRESLLSRTLLDIACTGGRFSVELRTSSQASYCTIVEGLPRLEQAMLQREISVGAVLVFLVGRDELP